MDKEEDNMEGKKNMIIPRMALNDNKAGMQGLDKDKINKVIMENTLGSRFYKNEQKRDAQVKQRIAKMKACLHSFSSEEREVALRKADRFVDEIEKSRDLTRTIIHIDMDAFYASVEERDMPELKHQPMAVGSMSMLSTSNYNARKFGVRAAMPGFIAMKLCPDLVIVPLNFFKYKQVSKEVQEIYAEYDENFMAASLDEAYLDITDHLQKRLLFSDNQRTFNCNPDLINCAVEKNCTNKELCDETATRTFGFNSEEVAEEIRFRIHQKTRLTASAGIAPNLMLAKIGSDFNKPNGQTHIPPKRDSIVKFIKDLSIRKVSGIGKVSEQLLSALGIKTCHDLYEHRADIVLYFSEASTSFFLRASLGCSSSIIHQGQDRKSISTERTFNTISRPEELFTKLAELCESLILDLKEDNIQGKTVTLKTKTIDFELHTRSKSTGRPLSTFEDIFSVAKELLKQEISLANNKLSLRLMGVGLSKLETLTGANQATIKKFFTKPEKLDTSDYVDDVCHCSREDEENITRKVDREYSAVKDGCDLLDKPHTEINGDSCAQAERSVACTNHDSIYLASTDETTLTCPICSFTFDNLLELNRHLDRCLKSDECSSTVHRFRPANGQATAEQPSFQVDSSERTAVRNDDDELTNVYACPICSIVFDSTQITLAYFNTHLDSCLNRKKIKEILKSDIPVADRKKSASPVKKPSKSSKRRKFNEPPSNTIDKFFS